MGLLYAYGMLWAWRLCGCLRSLLLYLWVSYALLIYGGISMAKQDNAHLYGLLMESRKRDKKHYGLSCIAVAYEDVRNYAKSKGCDRSELAYRAKTFSTRMREVVHRYGLSGEEVRAYFKRNNYALELN